MSLSGRERSVERTFHVRAEVMSDLAQDEVDVLLHGDGVGRHVGGCVCCPGDSHFLPGQEEDDTPIAGGGIQKPHVVWAARCLIQNTKFLTFNLIYYIKLNMYIREKYIKLKQIQFI